MLLRGSKGSLCIQLVIGGCGLGEVLRTKEQSCNSYQDVV